MSIWDNVICETTALVYWIDECPCCDLQGPDACCTCNQRVD